MNIPIIYEDPQIVVCQKLPGIPVQSDKTLSPDLVNGLRNYCHQKNPDQEPYIGLVHRLDRPVGGVMVFGKTPFATKELNRQIQQGQVKKSYLCVVTKDLSSQIQKEPVLLTDYLQKDAKNNCSKIVSANQKNAKKAQLYYKVLAVKEGFSLIEVNLLTGRHHQIRVQMAAHVAGIYGDSKYNPSHNTNGDWKNIALFSNSLTFTHPKTKKELCFTLSPTGDIWDRLLLFTPTV